MFLVQYMRKLRTYVTAGEEIVRAVPQGGKGGVGAVGHTGAGEHVSTTHGRRRDFR